MSLGKKRNYVTDDRRTRASLIILNMLTSKYEQEGSDNPSRRALEEIISGKHNKAIREQMEEIKRRTGRTKNTKI